jgi:uncharacterized protein
VIELSLPIPARLIEANPYVEEARNQVAVMRGPIVYCLESVDLPPDVRVMDVHIPRSVQIVNEENDELIPAMTTLRMRAMVLPQPPWDDHLYREAASVEARETDIRLIPYFAWDNRGESEMSVWLPVIR